MALQYRKRKSLGGGTRVNVSGSRRGVGLSVSQRVGPLTLNSRGRGSLRLAPGLSLRFGKRNDPVSLVVGLFVLAIILAVQVAVWILTVLFTVVIPVLIWIMRWAWFSVQGLIARRRAVESPEQPTLDA